MQTYWRLPFLLLVLHGFPGGTTYGGNLFDSAEQHPDGWMYLKWFGWFYRDTGNYIQHAEHGSLYLGTRDDDRLYFFDIATQCWFVTSKDVYPYIYKYGTNEGWYYYYIGGKVGERWFYRDRDGHYLMESKINLNDSVEEGFTLIRGGTFLMGSPEDELGRGTHENQTSVTIPHDYIVSEIEVTWEEWYDIYLWGITNGYTDLPEGRNGSEDDDSLDQPVTEVSWYDAIKWLNALSEYAGADPCYRVNGEVYRTGISKPSFDIEANGYRLLTEAEWENACRAGTTTAYYLGPITYLYLDAVEPVLDDIGWYAYNSEGKTHPVGLKAENQFGLYDMSGNVWEWCWNYYVDDYYGGPDTTGPSGGTKRVVRGGSVTNGPAYCRSAHRFSFLPNLRGSLVGFRIARTY